MNRDKFALKSSPTLNSQDLLSASLRLRKTMSKNLHPNFRDFVPEIRKNKLDNQKKNIGGRVNKHLLGLIDDKKLQNFNKEILGGKKLSYLEIRGLDSIYKKNYVNHMLNEDDHLKEYIQGHLLDIQENHH